MNIVGILLAAGRGTRFSPNADQCKLLAPVIGADGSRAPLAQHAARSMRAALGSVITVVGPDPGAPWGLLRELLRAQGCTVLACVPDGAGGAAPAGMGASIATAVRASAQADGWIIALADMPWVEPATIAALRRALQEGAPSAAPYFRGRRGHPVGFAAACGSELAVLRGDTGARALLERHPPVRIDVDDEGIVLDVDVPADLAQLPRPRGAP